MTANEDEIERERFLAHCCLVYYIRRASDGMIKIGYTTMIKERMRLLRVQFGGLELLATHSGNRGRELAMHEKFAALRIPRTEWFRPAPPLLQWISDMRGVSLYRETQCRWAVPVSRVEELLAADPAA